MASLDFRPTIQLSSLLLIHLESSGSSLQLSSSAIAPFLQPLSEFGSAYSFDVVAATSLPAFLRRLKTHLFRISFTSDCILVPFYFKHVPICSDLVSDWGASAQTKYNCIVISIRRDLQFVTFPMQTHNHFNLADAWKRNELLMLSVSTTASLQTTRVDHLKLAHREWLYKLNVCLQNNLLILHFEPMGNWAPSRNELDETVKRYDFLTVIAVVALIILKLEN